MLCKIQADGGLVMVSVPCDNILAQPIGEKPVLGGGGVLDVDEDAAAAKQ